ncbi:ATP-dependent nuclease [Clavibacter tessellarius]|uniref:ATP-dependent nuclease n=1 Tax=Clavibacter tessellarius TaxID=31965 RepID=UPI0039E94B3A
MERSEDKQVGVLTQGGVVYSNFHQGAGEDSVLDLLALVSKAPDKSLIIIDEVEASLHPQAQRGLMTELLRIANDKKLQVILSTHSPYILEQLPAIARAFVAVDRDLNREVLYGVTADFALNMMDNERHEELDLYCEDEEARYLIERILALGAPKALSRTSITPVGPANTVISLAPVAALGKLPRPGLCIVDADQAPGAHYLVLPGTRAPEKEAASSLSEEQWSAVAERLGRSAGEVLDAKDQALAIPNHHAWAGEIAKLLGGTTRPSKVWEAIADVWVRDILGDDAAVEWCEPIIAKLRS